MGSCGAMALFAALGPQIAKAMTTLMIVRSEEDEIA